ncbi:hypothetical protein, partial [Bifidobacterium breve]|uniref:hypothetical protein n=1 Tax=Bifidobacterium breve TaxID=1685 RepID=UPI001F2C3C9D
EEHQRQWKIRHYGYYPFHEAPLHMQYASVTSIYFCLPDEDTKEAMKLTRFHIRGMPTMKPQQKNGSARSMNQQTKRRAA